MLLVDKVVATERLGVVVQALAQVRAVWEAWAWAVASDCSATPIRSAIAEVTLASGEISDHGTDTYAERVAEDPLQLGRRAGPTPRAATVPMILTRIGDPPCRPGPPCPPNRERSTVEDHRSHRSRIRASADSCSARRRARWRRTIRQRTRPTTTIAPTTIAVVVPTVWATAA